MVVVNIDGREVEVNAVGFRGGHFTGFHARWGGHDGPGWYVFGRNPAYGGTYVSLVARPNVKPRSARYWNGKVRAGWKTKREAQAVADVLNARDRDSLGAVASLGELHGTEFQKAG